MLARVRVLGGEAHDELLSLYHWLDGEDALRGRVSREQPPPQPGDMGALTDVLVVAVGAGGTATTLAGAVSMWLQQRRSDVTVEITGRERTVRLEASRVADPGEFVRLAREALDEPSED